MDSLCLDFINTRWYLTHKTNREMLLDPEFVIDFFVKRGLSIEMELDSKIFTTLLELRTFLIEVLEGLIAGKQASKKHLAKINAYLAGVAYKREALISEHKYSLMLSPVIRDWKWVLSEIMASYVHLTENYDVMRIKKCLNQECEWIFYDESKSRTKRWCCDACGSLVNVRRFRANQKKFNDKE